MSISTYTYGKERERARIVAWLREHGGDDSYKGTPYETASGEIVRETSPGKLADAIEQGAHLPPDHVGPDTPGAFFCRECGVWLLRGAVVHDEGEHEPR